MQPTIKHLCPICDQPLAYRVSGQYERDLAALVQQHSRKEHEL